MHMRVEIAGEASDGVELVHVNATSVGVIEIVADVKIDNLAEHQAMWAMSNRRICTTRHSMLMGASATRGACTFTPGAAVRPVKRKFIDVWRILA